MVQNTYFEGMCELLNILIHKVKTAEKFLLDSEFRSIFRGNIYAHKNAVSKPNEYIAKYPFNATTTFRGGKQKTQKLRKINKRTYKKRLS